MLWADVDLGSDFCWIEGGLQLIKDGLQASEACGGAGRNACRAGLGDVVDETEGLGGVLVDQLTMFGCGGSTREQTQGWAA